jgi:hypothetical protein
MNDKDKKQFLEIMVPLGELYQKELSKTLLALYFSALSVLTLEEISLACSNHVRDPDKGMWFPKPADIISQFNRQKPKALATGDAAILAWMEVVKALESHCPMKSSPDIKSKVSNAAVQTLGGWGHLARQSYEELVWIKKEFISLYEAMSHQEEHLLLEGQEPSPLLTNVKLLGD